MSKRSLKINRRFFLLGLISICLVKSSNLVEFFTLSKSNKKKLDKSSDSNLYKWILDKNDF
jgi:hypothetical protein